VPCLQTTAKGDLDPRLTWADTCAVRLRQPVDLVHMYMTVICCYMLYVCEMLCVRGVVSGSRDVEAWCANGCTPRIGGSKY
jgi:hypothetical protein